MRTPRLTPAKTSLLMLGVATVSLVGLPGVGAYVPPKGALVGVVSTAEGAAVPDTPVGLFDAASLALVEITHTDAHGRFALQQAPESFHLCALPSPRTGLVAGWALDLERGPLFTIDLVLREGSPIKVRVTDDAGQPVAGADVRVYDLARRTTRVVARARTDERGRTTVLAPPRTHVGTFGPSPERLPAWSFELEVPDGGRELAHELVRGRRLHGRVRTPAEGAPGGMIVSAWDRRDGWQWNGYRLTEPDGAYALFVGEGTAEVRVLDRTQRFLPARATAGPTARLDVELAEGTPLEVRCEDAEGRALPARVWLFSEETGAWSWGSPTGADGRLVAAGSEAGVTAVAAPLHRGPADVEAWRSERMANRLVLVRARNEE